MLCLCQQEMRFVLVLYWHSYPSSKPHSVIKNMLGAERRKKKQQKFENSSNPEQLSTGRYCSCLIEASLPNHALTNLAIFFKKKV